MAVILRHVYTREPELEDPADYPVSDWRSQRTKYSEYWSHWDGGFLEETVSDTDKYPLKLNVYRMACMLHAGFLFGEVPDGDEPLVKVAVEPWGTNTSDEDKNRSKKVEDFLTRVWSENQGRALQQEAGIVSQILGGCAFGIKYDPSLVESGRIPIRIEQTIPEYFFPVWNPIEYWNLLETFIAFEITPLQAKAMYDVKCDMEDPLYQEHWKTDSVSITVDGKPAKFGELTFDDAKNGGFVPYTYIPHIRVGRFYGESLLYMKQPLAEEVNARMADLGDTIAETARQIPAVSNVKHLQTIRLSNSGLSFVNLGKTMPGHPDPAIVYPQVSGTNQASAKYASDLLSIARVQAYTPPICYGWDEGSQRSALTLALRMIPLIVHIRQERTNWTAGLNQVDEHVLRIAAAHKLGGIEVKDIMNLRIWQQWSPILPRGREQLINELILRLNSDAISPEQALDKFGDVRDTVGELGLIKQWMEYKAELAQSQQANPFGGAGSMGEQSGLSRPSKPSASVSQEE